MKQKDLEALDNFQLAKDVSRELDIPYSTLMTWVANGRVQAKKVGHAVLIHRDDVETLRADKPC